MSNPETLWDLLKHRVAERPDHTALIEGQARLSYGDLCRKAERLAAGAQAQGIGLGDRVLLLMPLSLEFFAVFMGLMQTGASVILIDPAAGLAAMRKALLQVRPDWMIGVPRAHLLRLLPELVHVPALSRSGWAPWSAPLLEDDGTPDTQGEPDVAALITFTSGSTGRPKVIVRSHRFLLTQHEAVQTAIHPQPDDIEFSTLPVFILSNIGAGITSVIPPAGYARPHRMDASKMVSAMKRAGANRLLAAPAFLGTLCDTLEATCETLGLRRILTGGGPVFPDLLGRVERCFPSATVSMVYGSSEAEPIAHLDADELKPSDLETIRSGGGLPAGRRVPQISLRIAAIDVSASDGLVAVPEGEAGEIVVSGDHVVATYLDPSDNVGIKQREDGRVWHRTGDAGRVDAEGRLWLLGRTSARLVRSAGTMWPFAVEAAARCVPGVNLAALVDIEGRSILAYEGAATPQDVMQACPGIDEARRIDSIPVDTRHHSKVLYAKLRTRLRR